jgi:hypothetical protein
MSDLSYIQYALIALIFTWSGFVRSGLGFGGAVLSLPLLLLVENEPLIFLPLISVHLLVFASATILASYLKNRRQPGAITSEARTDTQGTIDWIYLRKAMGIMIIPKLIGVMGLVTLPSDIMSGIIFTIVTIYAFSYILNRPFSSQYRWLDVLFLMLGAYISGTSLIGAPLIIAVFANHVAKHQLRDTLFTLWFILVSIKMSAFIYVGIDLQLIHHLWLLPAATIGHFIGLRFHTYMLTANQAVFFRVTGFALLLISGLGLAKDVFHLI